MKKISASDIMDLKASGAKVRTKSKPKPPPAPKKAPAQEARVERQENEIMAKQARATEEQARATIAMAGSLGKGQLMLAEKLQSMAKSNDKAVSPTPYKFVIIRDKRGLIDSVEAYPMEG